VVQYWEERWIVVAEMTLNMACNVYWSVIIDRSIEQGPTNPPIFLSETNEKLKWMGKYLYLFVSQFQIPEQLHHFAQIWFEQYVSEGTSLTYFLSFYML
jgi:hypothetical protein